MTIKVTWEPGYDKLPRMQWALEEEAFHTFSRFGVVHELTASENVFEQGRRSDALYIVLDGEIAILKDAEELTRIGPSISFGEMGLLLQRPRSASARAITDARVLELGQADIDRMLEEEPVWAARLYRVLGECLAEYLALSTDD
jgi:CRP-like cAMP-binding protein